MRDIRGRWHSKNGLPYRARACHSEKGRDHFALSPSASPVVGTDGHSIFAETGHRLHLGGRSEHCCQQISAVARSHGMDFRGANSVEMASLPWSIFKFSGDTTQTPGRKHLDAFLLARLQHMESVLVEREWLSNSFSIADILMADVLRLVDRFDGLAKHPSCRDYVARATARPSFVKAHADQMAHFAAAD